MIKKVKTKETATGNKEIQILWYADVAVLFVEKEYDLQYLLYQSLV